MAGRLKLHVVTSSLLLTALLPLHAHATCREKLVEVDTQIESVELGPTADGIKMMRDQAAMMCDQGQEEIAMQILTSLETSLPRTEAQVATQNQANADTKSKLTNEFLAGVWCSMTGEERSQLTFTAQGTYTFCVHDSVLGPYGHCPGPPQQTSDWLARYKTAKSVEQNSIEMGGGRRGSSTFKRGKCELHGR